MLESSGLTTALQRLPSLFLHMADRCVRILEEKDWGEDFDTAPQSVVHWLYLTSNEPTEAAYASS